MSSESSGLNSSLTDLAMSLMVIFILLLVTSLRDLQKDERMTRSQIKELKKELQKLVNDQDSLKGISIKIDENDPLTLVVIVPESKEGGELFKSNSSVIQPYLDSFIKTFAPPFLTLVTKAEWQDAIRSVIIEGHTDDVPVANEEYGNLRLSQERSKEVLQTFLEMAKTSGNATRDTFWSLASASGRAEKDCRVSEKPSPDERRKCRSVQFKIRLKSYMEKKFERSLPPNTEQGSTS